MNVISFSATMLDRAKRGRDFILDLIFPLECISCGREGAWICTTCLDKINFREFNSCFSCKKINLFGEFCPHCQGGYALDGIWIAGDYDNKIMSELIRKLKYYFVRDISEILGNFMSAYLAGVINCEIACYFGRQPNVCPPAWHAKIAGRPFINKEKTIIMPVPLHKRRERWRGFNQARLLAQVVADNFHIALNGGSLVRAKNNRPQASLNEEDRQKNILNCFVWKGEKLSGQTVILVDDIVTTGATLNECAKILKTAGAAEVWGLVAAKG